MKEKPHDIRAVVLDVKALSSKVDSMKGLSVVHQEEIENLRRAVERLNKIISFEKPQPPRGEGE